MIEVGETDHVAKHRLVRINPHGIVLKLDPAQLLRIQLGLERISHRLRNVAAQNHVALIGLNLVDQFLYRDF